MLRAVILLVAVACATRVSCSGEDKTRTPGTSGSGVAESVADLIRASCVFPDDKLLLRRLAYVETNDGQVWDTYPEDYHGGIWKVDEEMYEQTKAISRNSQTGQYIEALKTNPMVLIDWSKTTWVDLRKPLYSGLAAIIFINEQINGRDDIPRDTSQQADFWKQHYRTDGDKDYFITAVNTLIEGCVSRGADIVFLLDSSGSIGADNFQKVREFIEDVIDLFDLQNEEGGTKYQIGLHQFATTTEVEFYLDHYADKNAMLNHVRNINFHAGGTETWKGLDQLVDDMFDERNGARPKSAGFPRIAFVMTDGISENFGLTMAAAKRVHDAGILTYAIGVGASLNEQEINAIASEPLCLHRFDLSGFNDMEGFKYAIELSTCSAGIIIDPEEDVEIETPLPGGEAQKCQLPMPVDGLTVKVATDTGVIIYYMARDTYPSPSYYEQMVVAKPNHKGVLFIENAGSDLIFCEIHNNDTVDATAIIEAESGDSDFCSSAPCLNDGLCNDLGESFVCECPAGWTGPACETDVDLCKSYACANGGSCAEADNAATCSCTAGWTGDHCDEKAKTGSKCSCKDPARNPCGEWDELNPNHAHDDPTKFCQCDIFHACFEQSCPPGLVFNDQHNVCEWA